VAKPLSFSERCECQQQHCGGKGAVVPHLRFPLGVRRPAALLGGAMRLQMKGEALANNSAGRQTKPIGVFGQHMVPLNWILAQF
jgi:hypothetical protein